MQKFTKHGTIQIVIENGKKKLDFKNSKFNSTASFIAFLNDKDLTIYIFGY